MRKTTLLPMDELNNLTTKVTQNQPKSETEDDVLELLILAYCLGAESGSLDLNKEYTPTIKEINSCLYEKIAGKTFADRLKEYNTPSEINRVIETETHRAYTSGQLAVAKKFNAKKTWVTMLDDKVRDSHELLEGVTVGADELFYSGSDSAYAPGMFSTAENNVNCRCEIILKE